MPAELQKHIRKFVNIDDTQFNEILPFFKKLTFKKKENLVEEGQICRHQYFVATGCLRMFFLDGKGVERITQFALENWWLADYFSFMKHKPSPFSIQAVEKSEVWALSHESQVALIEKFPLMIAYFHRVHQTAHAAHQIRMRHFFDLSKEELFLSFSNSFPEFLQRIPQYMLASYLGITPEYLSELRAKHAAS